MRQSARTAAILLLMSAAAACGGHTSPAAPSTASTAPTSIISTPAPVSTFHVTGIVTEDDGSPIAGATVSIPYTSLSRMTDTRGSYGIDFDAHRGAGDLVGWVQAESAGHDLSYTYLFAAPDSLNVLRNLHVYRIKRITAGESTVVTVVPGDTSCGDNDQFTCRTVHIVAPADGAMTIEAVPTPSATNAGLEIKGGGGVAYQCCTTIAVMAVSAGTEVVVNVGMWWTSTAGQSFVLNTSLR